MAIYHLLHTRIYQFFNCILILIHILKYTFLKLSILHRYFGSQTFVLHRRFHRL